MENPEFKPIFDSGLVTARLTVQESTDKKALENPGGDNVMEMLGGKGAGLPFMAIVDSKGKLVINSNRPTPDNPKGSNIGHPYKPEEVDWFMAMLKKGAPRLTAEQTKKLETILRTQKKD